MSLETIRIHPKDNVVVAFTPLQSGDQFTVGQEQITLIQSVPRGHKTAICTILKGEQVLKYGFPIGHAIRDIQPGEWVHTHNTVTNLSDKEELTYQPKAYPITPIPPENFLGYQRGDGRVGIRNEIWILPLVGCVNDISSLLARQTQQEALEAGLDGVYAFPHPYGCSQMGEDHATTRKILAALSRHPNAGGVLIVGLGCENLTLEEFQQELGEWDSQRVKFMVCQQVDNELEIGAQLLAELITHAKKSTRETLPVSRLIVGLKCGGSDGLSGITANPLVGVLSDRLIARGGSSVLTEVPEMFGAEEMLLGRAASPQVFHKGVAMIDGFKDYYRTHNQVIYENPSPGNKEGGITTLEDKSLGCVQKGGHAPIVDVIDYGDRVKEQGLTLLSGPGNDLVSTTALTAAGCHLILFTTGRGTPFGAPIPTVKVSTNMALAQKKPHWIDFNAGVIATGEPMEETADRLLSYVIQLASGEVHTKNEDHGYREIAIFKDGVTL